MNNLDTIIGSLIAIILVFIFGGVVLLFLRGDVNVKDPATVGIINFIIGTLNGVIINGIVYKYFRNNKDKE